MPIYEYQCKGCGDVFEVLQKFDDPAPGKHESCGSADVQRVMSAGSFVLKGEGWYVTDYARKDQAKKNKKGGSEGGDSGSGSSDKSSSSSDKGSSGGSSTSAA